MKDRFGRTIDYLRISVTDRCNLRCIYCMPEEGVLPLGHEEILRYEEIVRIVDVAKELGINHIRLTGGEPLVRKDLIDLVKWIRTAGIPDISMTTNGTLLAPVAKSLKDAGLGRVNISLDTLDPEKFRRITRRGSIHDVLSGIRAAVDSGLNPVKLNMVVIAGLNSTEIQDMARLSLEMPVHVRFIEVMPIGPDPTVARDGRVTLEEIVAEVRKVGELEPVPHPDGAGPAESFKIKGGEGTVGFIAALSRPFCTECNRLRLTADGKIRPCLASDLEIDVKGILRSGQTDEEIRRLVEDAFARALDLKPQAHHLASYEAQARRMCQIGG
ncbi:MAG TPA: GTP 3',8-cyclase MoaA [Firmicutes bacterium]|nr:GTP 3',8-cyclase MoaA [Candidatus Fermentithermobacillaceae bacterium]